MVAPRTTIEALCLRDGASDPKSESPCLAGLSGRSRRPQRVRVGSEEAGCAPRQHRADELEQALESFLLDVRAANRSEWTAGFYQQKLTPFNAHLRAQGVRVPQEILSAHVRSFMQNLCAGHSPGGCHAY